MERQTKTLPFVMLINSQHVVNPRRPKSASFEASSLALTDEIWLKNTKPVYNEMAMPVQFF